MGARDGMQNEKTPVGPAERIVFLKKLLDAGLDTIEVGAFVSPLEGMGIRTGVDLAKVVAAKHFGRNDEKLFICSRPAP